MVILKIFPLEDTKEENTSILLEGEHVIGRGFLNCNDKRVSRKHAIITVCKDLVTIKSTHVNPCFFKAAKGGGVTILTKDTSVLLNDEDQFALLASLFWFKVRLNKSELSTDISQIPSTSKRNPIEENSMEMAKRQKVSNKDVDDTNLINVTFNVKQSFNNVDLLLDTNPNTEENENLSENIDSQKPIHNLKIIVKEDYGHQSDEGTVKDCVNKHNENGSVRIKEEFKTEIDKVDNHGIKEEGDIQVNNNGSNRNAIQNNNVGTSALNIVDNNFDGNTVSSKMEANVSDIVKTEKKDDLQNEVDNHRDVIMEEENDNKDSGNSSDANCNQNGASCSTNDNNKTRRKRCWYGPTCYRKNPIHRADFSHPGDGDYDTDPDDDRPLCPFGIACYRTNLQHQRQYKHSNPPAPKPNGGAGIKKKKQNNTPNKKGHDSEDEDSDNSDNKPRKRKAARNKNYAIQDSFQDDYDYDDPFIGDATSDEFELSSDDDDDDDDYDDDDSTDWEDSQQVDEESQDMRRLLKEAERFAKAKKK